MKKGYFIVSTFNTDENGLPRSSDSFRLPCSGAFGVSLSSHGDATAYFLYSFLLNMEERECGLFLFYYFNHPSDWDHTGHLSSSWIDGWMVC